MNIFTPNLVSKLANSRQRFLALKLILFVAAAISMVILTSIQPAVAQPVTTGSGYSQTGADTTTVEAQFNLSDKNISGQLIIDVLQNSADLGYFPGSIQNYCTHSYSKNARKSKLCYDSASRTNVVYPPFTCLNNEFAIRDLRAQLTKNFDIEYKIMQPGQVKATAIYTVPQKRLNGIDSWKAVNSLSYILEKNLLGLSEYNSLAMKATLTNSNKEILKYNRLCHFDPIGRLICNKSRISCPQDLP